MSGVFLPRRGAIASLRVEVVDVGVSRAHELEFVRLIRCLL